MFISNTSADAGNYAVPRSLRFRASASAYLSRTPSVAGNRKTWTWSGWVKRGALGVDQYLFHANTASTDHGFLAFLANDTIRFSFNEAGTARADFRTSQVFRDVGSSMHVHLYVDLTVPQINLYINGVFTPWGTTSPVPVPTDNTPFNAIVPHNIARYATGGSFHFDGYLSEVNFIDGQALTPSSFGQIDTTTGQWVAKKYTGTYGTNGFYLPFDDATNLTTLTADKSGNGNNWTATNISLTAGATYDSMLDVPAGNAWDDGGNGRGNYATLNPLLPTVAGTGVITISAGNLQTSGTSLAVACASLAFGSASLTYSEVQITSTPENGTNELVSITDVGYANTVFRAFASNGQYFNGSTWIALGTAWSTGDVIGVAVDSASGQISFYKNGVLQGATQALSIQPNYTVGIRSRSTGTSTFAFNFGQRPFAYTPPTGFKALHTGNLPEPAIKKSTDHHNVYTVTKSGNTNFTLDWDATVNDTLFWIKRRDAVGNWFQIDGLRGYDKYLSSNQTIAEVTDANVIGVAGTTITLKSTLPDGVYVIEAWKAGRADSRQTNTSGTITSTVSANVLAGFSIVLYTGTGANATVGHGIGNAPKMIHYKTRNGVSSHVLGHGGINGGVSPWNYALYLDTTAAQAATASAWNNTAPTSTLFSIGAAFNGAGLNTVAYCFAEVPQYSKFGNYAGNGSADGPFAYAGFLPRDTVDKRTDLAGNWIMYDSARDTYNAGGLTVYPNLNSAEGDGRPAADIISNGLKLRATYQDINASGGTYITSLFAQAPIKYANAR